MGSIHSKSKGDSSSTQKHPPNPPQSPPTQPPPQPPPPPATPLPTTEPTDPTAAATSTSTQNDTGPTPPTDPHTPTKSQSFGDSSSTAAPPGQSAAAKGDSGASAQAVPSSLSSTGDSPHSKTGDEGTGPGAASPTAPANPQLSTSGIASLVTQGDLSPPAPSASAISPPPSLATSLATAASAKGTNMGAIIAGVIVPLFVLLFALAAYLAYKRRKRLCDRRQWERTHEEIADAVAKVGGPATIPTSTAQWTRFDSASRGNLADYANEKQGSRDDTVFFASRVP